MLLAGALFGSVVLGFVLRSIATYKFGKSETEKHTLELITTTPALRMIVTVVLHGVNEEAFFRLILIGLLGSAFPPQWLWLVLSSFAFGLIHIWNVGNRAHRPFLAAAHTVSGLIYGMIFLRYGFVIVCAAHIATNLALISFARIVLHLHPDTEIS